VAVLDVDNFKNLNDSLGHAAGDELLVFLGELLRRAVRETDLAIRMGGDEFALVLPETDLEKAVEIVRRLTALFGQMVRTLPPIECRPSLSVGVAALRSTGARSGKELLRAADTALYQAKQRGKARVETAPDKATVGT
jgi:diguanylate cyclase (GGDEF)-like protein